MPISSLRKKNDSISSFNNNHKHKVSNSSYLGSLIIHLTTNIQNLKSCYNSHLISPTRLLLSVKQLKSVEEVKDKVSYGAMVWCCAVLFALTFCKVLLLLLLLLLLCVNF
jgi:ABC-type nickel/cobalt efflux system permease component RcnA